jgi:cytochrome P450
VWLVRNLIGYAVLRYEDAIGVLRDKRWHSASGRIPELMGITREDFLVRQRGSILSAEGDEHVRLRRLVAPAFNPRARPTACGRSCAR